MYRWFGIILQKLWKDLLHGLGLAYDWLQTAYEFIAAKAKAVFLAMPGVAGLLTEFVPRIVRHSSVRQSQYSEYDDDEIWNDASISLENLDGIS